MTTDTEPPADTASELELVIGQRRLTIPAGRPFVLGRGPDVDLDLNHPKVSRRHLVLEAGPAGWQATDASRNGTFRDRTRLAATTLITEPMTLLLGGPADGQCIEIRPGTSAPDMRRLAASQQGRLSTVHQVRASTIRIGRHPDNDMVIDDLLVSRRHCELRYHGGTWTIVDLDSPNGTFVNGRRASTSAVRQGDVVGVGHTLLQLEGDQLVAFVDDGDISFEAADLTVTTKSGKTLLQSVGFTLGGNTLLGVIGPSGAGKSTLLNAMIGTRPASSGTVRYAGRDLYDDYDELRHRIALVPQDDVLHTQLTVRQALSYAARLRFPADTTAADRQRRITEVIAELGLTAQADQRITSLSGGQRKRTSVALELLTKPSLLFLDEPTSGLDPGMDRAVMQTLRDLADDGRTVVVVTHSITNLQMCDKLLILAPGGHVAYFGSPDGALAYFGRDFTDIFVQLANEPGEVWARRFRQSEHYRPGAPAPHQQRQAAAPSAAPRQQNTRSQFAVLVRRYLAVIASDRQYAIFLVALPLVLSLLARAVPGSAGLSVEAGLAAQDYQPRQLLLVLVIGASLMGAAASMRELVKERAIYERERAIGLSVTAYLASKILVLLVITGLQAAVFMVLGVIGRNGPDDPLLLSFGHTEVLLAVLAVAVSSMMVGLLISAIISNADRGMPLLVLMIMVQLILCGGLFEVYGRPWLEQASWLVPARWGFSMAAATADVGRLSTTTVDPLWEHTIRAWGINVLLLAGITVIVVAATAARIRRLDPQRRPRR